VHRPGDTAAAYFVQWTRGQVDRHGATVDLIIGLWGEGASPADRCSVSLQFCRTDQGPAFMVIDSASRPVASSNLVSTALARDEVIGTSLARTAFDMVDAIWLQDERLAEVAGAASSSERKPT
jgi:hypothetical protein